MNSKRLLGVSGLALTSILILIACTGKSKPISKDKPSDKTKVDLQWRIPAKENLIYTTVMSQIGKSKFEMDFSEMFEQMNSGKPEPRITNTFFNKLRDSFNDTNIYTVLSNSETFQDVIEIEMLAEDKESDPDEDEMSKIMASMMKGTMLRGSVYNQGPLHSFWVKSPQKNLLSLFFELPEKPVSIGDSWTLNSVNLIGNDQNFICKEASKHNQVTLKEIVERDGETIAKLDYDILESVSGTFTVPAFLGQNKPGINMEMDFIYKAKAEFSIDKGKWLAYNGIMSSHSTGFMQSEGKQKFALIERKK